MNPASPIVLPRPNLGPEPWPEPPLWPWLVAAGVIAGLVTLVVRIVRRRRRSRYVEAKSGSPVQRPTPFAPELTDRVRSALVRAFGPSWRARTTEEVAASAELSERFGEEVAARVVDYLRAVDRSKFSADPAGPPDELDWWAARFAEEVESAPSPNGEAKAKSRINGK
jgi:hypothetical protein